MPTISARISRWSASTTVMSGSCRSEAWPASPVTTWLLVRMYPSALMTTPEPRLFSTLGPNPNMSLPPKKLRKNGSLAKGELGRFTTCTDEMLTTGGTVRSATPVKSGSVAATAAGASLAGATAAGAVCAVACSTSWNRPVSTRPPAKPAATRPRGSRVRGRMLYLTSTRRGWFAAVLGQRTVRTPWCSSAADGVGVNGMRQVKSPLKRAAPALDAMVLVALRVGLSAGAGQHESIAVHLDAQIGAAEAGHLRGDDVRTGCLHEIDGRNPKGGSGRKSIETPL